MSRRSLANRAASFAVVAVLAVAPAARATDAEAQAAAESLFKAARKLMVEGRYAEACPKLAESQRLDPAAGTLLNLADCYERTGRTASAWVTFTDAAKAANERHRADWRATALERAQALERQLLHLVVEVPADNAVAGLTITRDGLEVGPAEWGVEIPVDPGEHVVVARAPGRVAWTSRTRVEGAHASTRVTVPELAQATEEPVAVREAAPERAASSPPARPSTTMHTLGIVGLAAGATGVGVGIAAGAFAWAKKADVDRACPRSPCANADGLSANDTAHQAARVSTVAFVAGLVLAAGGVTLLVVSPARPSRTGLVFAPNVGPAGASLDVTGRF